MPMPCQGVRRRALTLQPASDKTGIPQPDAPIFRRIPHRGSSGPWAAAGGDAPAVTAGDHGVPGALARLPRRAEMARGEASSPWHSLVLCPPSSSQFSPQPRPVPASPRRGGSGVPKMPLAPAQVGRLPEEGAGFLGGPCGPRGSAASSPRGHSCAHGRSPRAARQLRGRHLGPGPGAGAAPAVGPGAAAAPPTPGGGSRSRPGPPSPRRQNGCQFRERTSRARTPAPIDTLSPLPRAQRRGSKPGTWAAAPSATRGGSAPAARPASHPLRARGFQGAFRAEED